MRKLPALFYEFEETGTNGQRGYTSPDGLLDDYPAFYWNVAHRYIQDGLQYLQMTQAGKQWIANLYAHVFAVEHRSPHQRGRTEALACCSGVCFNPTGRPGITHAKDGAMKGISYS